MSALALAPEAGAPRMSEHELAVAIVHTMDAIRDDKTWKGTDTARQSLRAAARAIMQLWGDLDAEERLTARMQNLLVGLREDNAVTVDGGQEGGLRR